jgi:hypothetical protein
MTRNEEFEAGSGQPVTPRANFMDFFGQNNKDIYGQSDTHVGFHSGHDAAWYVDTGLGFDHPLVQKAFNSGQCHGLALAINKLYGNKLGAVVWRGSEQTHYFAYDKEDPSYGWDMKGKRPVQDIVNERQGRTAKVVSPATIKKHTGNSRWLPIKSAASEQAAKWLMER